MNFVASDRKLWPGKEAESAEFVRRIEERDALVRRIRAADPGHELRLRSRRLMNNPGGYL